MSKRIFISYKRVNLDIVKPLVEEIERRLGVPCWIDLEGIESGDQFENRIIKAINDADIVLFMMTKESIAPYTPAPGEEENENDMTWTQMEVNFALRKKKKLVPVSLDGTQIEDWDWLSLKFNGKDYIQDINVPEQKAKLFNNLRTWLGIPDDESVKQEIEDLKTQWEANNAQLKELSAEQDRCLKQILEREKRIGDNSASKAIMSQDQASVGNGSMQMMMQMMSTMMQMQKPAASQASEEVEEGLMIVNPAVSADYLHVIDKITHDWSPRSSLMVEGTFECDCISFNRLGSQEKNFFLYLAKCYAKSTLTKIKNNYL